MNIKKLLGLLLAACLALALFAACGEKDPGPEPGPEPESTQEPEPVYWVNAYAGENGGELFINNSDEQGVHYVLELGGDGYTGVAPVNPDDPYEAENETFKFQLNPATWTVYVTGAGLEFEAFTKQGEGVG